MNKLGTTPIENLTAMFQWNNKECLIGKFDPANPEVLIDKDWDKLGYEILEQINNSGTFTKEEMENLAMMPADMFIMCIFELG